MVWSHTWYHSTHNGKQNYPEFPECREITNSRYQAFFSGYKVICWWGGLTIDKYCVYQWYYNVQLNSGGGNLAWETSEHLHYPPNFVQTRNQKSCLVYGIVGCLRFVIIYGCQWECILHLNQMSVEVIDQGAVFRNSRVPLQGSLNFWCVVYKCLLFCPLAFPFCTLLFIHFGSDEVPLWLQHVF